MRVICDRTTLLRAWRTAARFVPTRSPKPALRHVKLVAGEDGVSMIATDLETSIRIDVPSCAVDAPGAALMPVARVGPILRDSRDDQLIIESDGCTTHVRGDGCDVSLVAPSPSEMPDVGVFTAQRYHVMPARFFCELARRTVFATDNENGRYALDGVLLELSDNQVIAVATDRRRLALQRGPAVSVAGHKTTENTIIPTRAMRLFERALAGHEGDIQLAVCRGCVMIHSDCLTMYARLMNGCYPAWRDVVPTPTRAVTITLPAGQCRAAVGQAATATSADHRGIDFTFGDGKAVLAAHGAETGEARVVLPVAYAGAEVSVTLDARYVNDFLRMLDPDQCFTFQIKDADSAVLCTTDDGYSYVIMSMARDR